MTQPLVLPAPAQPAAPPRGPATTFVQRITAASAPVAAPPAAAPLSFARAAGGVLGDVVVGAPTSAALGVIDAPASDAAVVTVRHV